MTITTLIAAGRLDERLLAAALERLPGTRLARWIDAGDAADLDCPADPPAIRAALEGWEGVDVVAHPPGPREKQLFIADMDSTMIGQECIDELADYAGIKPAVAAITERAMLGQLDFAAALRQRVALLAGLEEAVVARCLAERVRPNPGAQTLVATLAGRGVTTILVTGGFTAFAEPVARELGFARFEANRLEVADGRLTGRVTGAIVDGSRKAALLEEARAALEIDRVATMAAGDGANDRAMIEAAGLGIGIRPKPALAEVADAVIRHHDLTALLWAQGIPSAEWAVS